MNSKHAAPSNLVDFTIRRFCAAAGAIPTAPPVNVTAGNMMFMIGRPGTGSESATLRRAGRIRAASKRDPLTGLVQSCRSFQDDKEGVSSGAYETLESDIDRATLRDSSGIARETTSLSLLFSTGGSGLPLGETTLYARAIAQRHLETSSS